MLYANIKKLCESKGISISQIERTLSLPRSSICKWNENEPGVRKVQKVANYLGVPIEQLLENSDCGDRGRREQNASNQNQ